MSDSIENATLLAKGTTADVYAWGEGRILKLFTERTPWHANEVSATRVAHEAHLPVPEVMDGLTEVGQREGIILIRSRTVPDKLRNSKRGSMQQR
jgi:hypothetical protein